MSVNLIKIVDNLNIMRIRGFYTSFSIELIVNKYMYNKLKQTMKKLLLFVLVYMSGLSVLLAQSVSGTVTDENGEGIPGVNIVVKGSTTGTITDFDGNYSVDAAEGDVLVVSYVGYSSQEITVGSQSNISIQLQLDVASLDEIVVTGFVINEERK